MHMNTVVKLWLLVIIGLFVVTFRSTDGATKNKFDDPDFLRQRLGSDYNERYMAMDDTDLRSKINQSPSQNQDHVSKQNLTELSSSMSFDRQSTDPSNWKCQTSTVWQDLGQNFYPRHVRSVTCSSQMCWFGYFYCRPQQFTIKLFKKKLRSSDVVVSSLGSSSSGKPKAPRFEDFWEKVDKQVTLYCECGR